jgi:formamidopyrimidine-DNA glycosylase
VPELPEVEVVRRGLDEWVAGRAIDRVDVYHDRAVRRHLMGAGDLAARLRGQTLVAAMRRGKYLWFPLSDGQHALVAHLGMSGQLLVQPADHADELHLRVRIQFRDHGRELRFVDQRTFGGLALEELVRDEYAVAVPASIAHIARDPFDEHFEVEDFIRDLRHRRTGIKRALLDQSLISGVGNIYADESLWRARLHYAKATDSMTRQQTLTLLNHVRDVMREALDQGGTSFDSLYVDVNGRSGYFGRGLNVYGRRDEACPRCGSLITRDAFMNRSSFRCPRCQRIPRSPRW